MKKFIIILITVHCSLINIHAGAQSCLPEGITFSTQAQIDNFQTNYPGCAEIEGDVIISGEGITNLNGLSVLSSIVGDLEIYNTSLINMNGLNSLITVEGNMKIGGYPGNPMLLDLGGLEALTSIGGLMRIARNHSLNSLSGLQGLTSIGGSLRIQANWLLTNLAGLEGITSIGGSLHISENYGLIDLTGLEGVSFISDGLYISYNFSLIDLTGLDGLYHIAGMLYIFKNHSLSSLTGLDNLDSIEGDLTIAGNDSLSVCEVPFICNYLSDPPGSINIYNNAPGCSGLIELAYHCGITYDCLESGTYHLTSQGDIDYFALVYPGCTDLTAGISIEGNHITDLDSLYMITSIEGGLFITNTSLSNLSGLNGLDSLGGTLYLRNNAIMENLSGLENLVSIGGNLQIGQDLYGGSGNPALTSLSGLENLDTIGGGIYIYYNDSLSVCNIPFICDYLSDSIGNIEIHNNAPGCDGVLEVAYHCGITYPCLTEGTYNFYGQGDIDYFALVYPGCSNLEANVKIRGYNITNLDSLNVITNVDGDFKIFRTSITDFTGLENLSYISGDFEIGYFDYWWGCFGNPNLHDFIGLEELDSIGGNLQIQCNTALTSLNGLEELTSINGSLGIGGNDSLVNLNGLEGLASVGGSVLIGVCGTYGPAGNFNLESLAGLEDLNTIGGGLCVDGNPSLTSLNGLEGLAFISGDLNIRNNDSLIDLTGMEELDSIGGNLWIHDNSLLCNCATPPVCSYLSNPSGSVNIYRNSSGCNTPAEIADSCGFTLPCLPYGNYYFHKQEDIDHFQAGYPGCTVLNGNVEISGENIINLAGLNVVTSIGGSLDIDHNDSLTSFSGLEGLTSIGERLFLYNNDALTSLSGLENLESTGSLTLYNNYSLTTLDALEKLETISGGNLRIGSNDSLTTLAGIENIDAASITGLYIKFNSSLSTCEVQSICDYLAAPGGAIEIYDNAPGCNSPVQIQQACESMDVPEFNTQNSKLNIQIYPNPTNGISHFAFHISQYQYVTLKIYDVHGREVAVVLEEMLPAGEHVVRYDMTGLPAGVYVVELRAKGVGRRAGGVGHRVVGKVVKMD